MFKIFVGNLTPNTTIDALKTLFSRHADVEDIAIATNPETGKMRGFAIVMIRDEAQGKNAIAMLRGSRLNGKVLIINQARKRGEKAPPKRPGGRHGGGPGGGSGGPGGGGFRGRAGARGFSRRGSSSDSRGPQSPRPGGMDRPSGPGSYGRPGSAPPGRGFNRPDRDRDRDPDRDRGFER